MSAFIARSDRHAALNTEIDESEDELQARRLWLEQLDRQIQQMERKHSWATGQKETEMARKISEKKTAMNVEKMLAKTVEIRIKEKRAQVKVLEKVNSKEDIAVVGANGEVNMVRHGQVLGNGRPSAREQAVMNGKTVHPMTHAIVDLESSQRRWIGKADEEICALCSQITNVLTGGQPW